MRNQQNQDQIAAGSSSSDYGEGSKGGELETSNSRLPTCTLPAGLGTALGASIFSTRIPWDVRGPWVLPTILGTSSHRCLLPARHGEPEHQPEEESYGAALQGGGDDCWRAAEVGGDGALLQAVSC